MDGSGCYYYTYSFTEDERKSLKEFFGQDLLDGGFRELTEDQIDQISARIMPRARSSIRVSDLLVPLRKFKALTDTEYSHLRSGSLEAEEQAVRLMEYLTYKGSYGLAALYLSLLTSSESKKGLPAHYQLAGELRDIVREYGVSEEEPVGRLEDLTNGTESYMMPLRAAVKQLQGIRLSPETAQTLASHLSLPPHQRVSTDLCELCYQWLRGNSACDIMELVKAMVMTKGLGRYTTRLCGPSSESPRDLRNFLLTLGERWIEIARYLGFSQEELHAIISSYPGSISKQVEEFLEKWKMPDSGQKTLPLMHQLKAQAGIVEPRRDRADSLPSGRRPWLDNSGVPPRRLDSYAHPHKRPPPPPPPHSTHRTSHSHSGHVHSFHHHPNCPFHHMSDGQTESYDDDYYSSYSGTVPVGNGAKIQVTMFSLSSGGSRKGYQKQNPLSNTDPVIEELPSDFEDHPQARPQPAIMGNEVTVPHSRSSSSPSSRTPTSTASSSPPSSRRIRTEPHAVLGNEVLYERSPSLSEGQGQKRGSYAQGNLSTPLGNEVVMKGRPSSGDGGRRGGMVEREENSFGGQHSSPLGNEVFVDSHSPSDSRRTESRRLGDRSSSALGNEVLLVGPPSINSSHSADMRRVASLGNEVSLGGPPPHGNHSRRSDAGRSLERDILPRSRIAPPGMNNLGNEVPVSGSRGRGGASRGMSAEMMGNEVSLPGPGGRLGSKKPRVDESLPQAVSLGNEIPMQRPRGSFTAGVVDNGLLSVQPSSLPSGMSNTTGRRERSVLGNEAECSDSSYTTTSGASEVAASLSSQNSIAHRASGPATLHGSGTALQGPAVPPNSRSPSPDNDFSDEDESPNFSNHSGPPAGQPSFSGSSVSPDVTMNIPSSVPPTVNDPQAPSSRPIVDPVNITSSLASVESLSRSPAEESLASQQMGPVTQSNQVGVGQGGGGTTSGGGSGGMAERDDGNNDLDLDSDEDGDVSSQPARISPPHDQPLSSGPLSTAHSSDWGSKIEGERGGEAGVADNVLSDPAPETPNIHRISAPVFMQASYSSQPDNSTTSSFVDPTIFINDLSTGGGGPSTLPPAGSSTGDVEEFCSEDVLLAVQERDGQDMLTALVASGASLNLPGRDGDYPIHLAVVHRHHDTVLFLLDKEPACIKQRRSDGKTPLHVACLISDFHMIQILVEKGADLTAQDSEGYTCMHLKETLQTINHVRYLDRHGAPIDTPSPGNYLTPLMVCCHIGDEAFETAQFLLSKRACVNGYPQAGMKPLIIACSEGFEVLVDVLLEYNADINIQDHDGNTALLKVCESGPVSMAKKLCERRSDSSPNGANVNLPNNEGLTPILAAVLKNEKELVVTLLAHGATIDIYKLHKIRVGGDDKMLEVSPLSYAAAIGNTDMVQLLVQNGASIHASASAMAPVTIAAMCGQLAVVNYFLNLNDLDLSLQSIAQPFVEAVKANQFDCAEAIAMKKYRDLDEMRAAAQQLQTRELVDSITQLQDKIQSAKAVPPSQSLPPTSGVSSPHPSSAPQTNSMSTTLQPPQHRQTSAPISHSATPTLLPLSSSQPADPNPALLQNQYPVTGLGEENENNLDDEDSTSPSAGQGSLVPLPVLSSASNVIDTVPSAGVSGTVVPESRELEDENNLDDEDRITTSGEADSHQTVLALPVDPSLPSSQHCVTDNNLGQIGALSEANENDLDEDDPIIPLGEGSSPPTHASPSQTLPPAPSISDNIPGINRPVFEGEENNLDEETPPILPGRGSSEHAVPVVSQSLPSAWGNKPDTSPGIAWAVSEADKNNLDDEDPQPPLPPVSSGGANNASAVSSQPTVQAPNSLSLPAARPQFEENNLDDEESPKNPVSVSVTLPPSLPAAVAQADRSNHSQLTVTPPETTYNNLDAENDFNVGDGQTGVVCGATEREREEGLHERPGNVMGLAVGGATTSAAVSNNLTSSPVVVETTSNTVASFSTNGQNNLDEEDEEPTAVVGAGGTQQNTVNNEAAPQNSVNELQQVVTTTTAETGMIPAEDVEALNNMAEENNFDEEEEMTVKQMAAVPAGGSSGGELVAEKNASFASSTVATAQEETQNGQVGSTPVSSNSLGFGGGGPTANSGVFAVSNNNLDVDNVGLQPLGSSTSTYNNLGREGDPVQFTTRNTESMEQPAQMVQEHENNLDVLNDLNTDDSGGTRGYTSRLVGHDELTMNNFDEPEEDPLSSQPTSLPSHFKTSTSQAAHSSGAGDHQAIAKSQSPYSMRHSLTEENKFDEVKERKDLSRDDTSSNNKSRDWQGFPPPSLPTSAPQRYHVRWATEAEDMEDPMRGQPLPTSAPVGHSSRAPLRASVDVSHLSSSLQTPPSGTGTENLFAPRPKSPPTHAPSPPRPSPYNMLSMAGGQMGMDELGVPGEAGGSIEVLHDFAQICMVTANRNRGQEFLINKAIESDYDHLTQFFIKYFHEGVSLSIGGKLVSEFLGGNPSPLNFLIAGGFINQASFGEAARDLGQPDFMNQLTVALHQFPGSEGLPYTGDEMAEGLFTQSFSIGHRYPNPSSLWSSSSSSSSLPQFNTSAPSSFPGRGHQLGSSSHDYHNSPRPLAAGTPSTPGEPSSLPSKPSQPSNSDISGGGSGTHHRSSVGSCPPPNRLSLLPSSKEPPWSSNGGQPRQKSGDSLTEEKALNENSGTQDVESGALNDLTTEEEESVEYYPGETSQKSDQGQLLGNEIVAPVRPSHVLSAITPDSKPSSTPPPTSSVHSSPPTPPNDSMPVTVLPHTSPFSPSPPLDITKTDKRLPTSLPHPLHQSPPITPSVPTDYSSSLGKEEMFDLRPVSLTPSPDPIPAKKPPTLVLKISKPLDPPIGGTDAVSPQSSSGFQSPRSLSPTSQGPPPNVKEMKPLVQQVPHSDGSIAGSRGNNKSATKQQKTKSGTKTSCGSGLTKTKAVSSASPSTVRSKTAPAKPPTGAVAAARSKKNTLPGASSKSKTPSAALSKPVAPKVGSKPAAKAASSLSPRPPRKMAPPAKASGSRETGPPATVANKSHRMTRKSVSGVFQPSPATSKRTVPTASRALLPPEPSNLSSTRNPTRNSPRQLTNKPPSSRLTSKSSSAPTSKKELSSVAGAVQTKVPPAATLSSLPKNKVRKLNTSKSSLTDEEVSVGSGPSTSQEEAGGSKTISPVGSVTCGSATVVGPMVMDDIISFPNTVIRDPETCPLLKALAHRIIKWKIFGRYLGLTDQELDNIEQSNHFTSECCLKMLVTWSRKFGGRYSELEAAIHNIMREDLVEDVRPLLPVEKVEQFSGEERGNTLKFVQFGVDDGSQNFDKLTKCVTRFLRGKCHGENNKIMFQFSHEKLHSPLEIYLPPISSSSSGVCDLTVVQELCFAAQNRRVSTVDIVFEVQS